MFGGCGIDPHHLRLTPTASRMAPTAGMTLPGLLIDLRTVARDGTSFSAVPLIRRDEPNPVMAVLVVLPLNERCYPAAGFFHTLKGPSGVVGTVFDRAEQRFKSSRALRVRVLIADFNSEFMLSYFCVLINDLISRI